MIHVRGPLAGVIIVIIAIFGFLLALGDVLDFYDAWWKITVPLTLVYAAGIWIFGLRPIFGDPPPPPSWPLGLDIILAKLFLTVGALFVTLGVVALSWDLCKLIAQNWHYIVVALGLVAVIVVWAMLAGGGPAKRGRTSGKVAGKVAGKAAASHRRRRASGPGDVAP